MRQVPESEQELRANVSHVSIPQETSRVRKWRWFRDVDAESDVACNTGIGH